MEKYRTQAGAATSDDSTGKQAGAVQRTRKQQAVPASFLHGSSLLVGAKTLAGIGIGLLVVVAGVAVVGVATEAVLVPSLLLKLAGGIAGGGVGMSKGLTDAQKTR